MRILVILGEGGHTKEMLALVEHLGDGFEYSYLAVEGDPLSARKVSHPGPIYRARRPRDKSHHVLKDICKTLQCGFQSWQVLRRVRPGAVLGCGPAVAAPACLLAKLLGVKVIFIETGSRIRGLSLTGKLVYPLADLFLVQWPQLAATHAKAVYAGRFW
jgi:UDP-N-acetylglucosamine:LPS N-acetylglucosamine transferase